MHLSTFILFSFDFDFPGPYFAFNLSLCFPSLYISRGYHHGGFLPVEVMNHSFSRAHIHTTYTPKKKTSVFIFLFSLRLG